MKDSNGSNKPLNKPLKEPLIDRGEHVSTMEPLLVASQRYSELADLVLELVAESASLAASLPSGFQNSSTEI